MCTTVATLTKTALQVLEARATALLIMPFDQAVDGYLTVNDGVEDGVSQARAGQQTSQQPHRQTRPQTVCFCSLVCTVDKNRPCKTCDGVDKSYSAS